MLEPRVRDEVYLGAQDGLEFVLNPQDGEQALADGGSRPAPDSAFSRQGRSLGMRPRCRNRARSPPTVLTGVGDRRKPCPAGETLFSRVGRSWLILVSNGSPAESLRNFERAALPDRGRLDTLAGHHTWAATRHVSQQSRRHGSLAPRVPSESRLVWRITGVLSSCDCEPRRGCDAADPRRPRPERAEW